MIEEVRGVRLTVLANRNLRAPIKRDRLAHVTLLRRPLDKTWVLGVDYWVFTAVKFAGNAWVLKSTYRESPDFDMLMAYFESVEPGEQLTSPNFQDLYNSTRALV